MGICSIILKQEQLEKEVSSLTGKYNPSEQSSFKKISHELLDRISDADRAMNVSEGLRADLINYLCDSVTALESYIKIIEENEEFRKYEMSEALGVFSGKASPIGYISKDQALELQTEPVKYVSAATEYFKKAA
jgi:hypothetical protein